MACQDCGPMLIPCPTHEEFLSRNYCDNCDYAPMHGKPVRLEDLRYHCHTCAVDRINELQQYGLRLEKRVKKLESEIELLSERDELKAEVKRLKFMVDNGLGWEDVAVDPDDVATMKGLDK